MANSPVKIPPIAQVEAGEASVPSLVVESTDNSSQQVAVKPCQS